MAIRPHRHGAHEGFSRPPTPAIYRRIAYSFFAFAVLVVIGALWISSVRARVTIHVKKQSANLQTTVDVSKSPEQGQLPGRIVEGTFEKIQEFSVKANNAPVVDTPVVGTVKIVNSYSKEQTLVSTTRLLTSDGRLYRLDKTVVVPSGGSVTVLAHSDQNGAKYVIPVGTKLSIPGLWIDLQKWIYAESVSGFQGGSASTKIVTQLDVSQSEKALEDAVFEQAKSTLAAQANVGQDYGVVYQKKVVDEKSNVQPGQQSDSFLVSVKLDVTAVYYPNKDMEALLRTKLKERLPDGYDLTNFDPKTAVFSIERADPTVETSRLDVSAQAASQLSTDSPSISKDAIAGLSVDAAKMKLQAVDGVDSVDIEIRPTWIGKLPGMKDHIDLTVQ